MGPKPSREILSFLEEQGLCEHSTAQAYCDIIDSFLTGQITEKGPNNLWEQLGGRGRAASTITRALGRCKFCKEKKSLVIVPEYDIEVEEGR